MAQGGGEGSSGYERERERRAGLRRLMVGGSFCSKKRQMARYTWTINKPLQNSHEVFDYKMGANVEKSIATLLRGRERVMITMCALTNRVEGQSLEREKRKGAREIRFGFWSLTFCISNEKK